MRILAGKYAGQQIEKKKQLLFLIVPNPNYAAQKRKYDNDLVEYEEKLTPQQKRNNDIGGWIGGIAWIIASICLVLIFTGVLSHRTWEPWLAIAILFLGGLIVCAILTTHGAPTAPPEAQILLINNTTIANIEELNENNRKSFISSYGNAWAGGIFGGEAGRLAGAMSGNTVSSHLVAITWRDGGRSLAQLDGDSYRLLLTVTFK